ncbi:MAG: diguanylate cyclase [Eubacteriales bacterium]|nr:diguanylate cyclase [Eubacteriales bacterium]
MNFLSFIAIMSASFLFLLSVQRLNVQKHDKINNAAILVLLCLTWWNVCDAFFYLAASKPLAWFWHQLGAVGWCGFIAVTAYYFLTMTGVSQKMKWYAQLLYWLPPLGLTLRFVLEHPTGLAEDLTLSSSGLGWTYVQRYQNLWPFVFLAYLLVYMGGALCWLYRWQTKVNNRSAKAVALKFIKLDSAVIAIGFLFSYVLPYFSDFLPPLNCVATLIFALIYQRNIVDFDFFTLELALNPGFILESCIEAMVVMDEQYRILYTNEEAKKLLREENLNDRDYLDFLSGDSAQEVERFIISARDHSSPLNLQLKSGIPILCSINRTSTRKKNMNVCIICMTEISRLKTIQDQLDYLAHYDELTGLINRRRFNELLTEWVEDYQKTGQDFELLFLDLMDFKRINDDFGHLAGDSALIATGKALNSILKPGDVLARFAGDEFVILRRGKDSHSLVKHVQKEVNDVDCSAFAPGLTLGVDVGRGSASEAGDGEELLQMADKQMYAKKRKRKETYGSPARI